MDPTIYIRASKDLRNNFAEISALAKEHPVAITVNGKESVIVSDHGYFMELLRCKAEKDEREAFLKHIRKSVESAVNGRVIPMDEAFDDIIKELKERRDELQTGNDI